MEILLSVGLFVVAFILFAYACIKDEEITPFIISACLLVFAFYSCDIAQGDINYKASKQIYCTKYYNNNVNKYKSCMSSDLQNVILNGLEKK